MNGERFLAVDFLPLDNVGVKIMTIENQNSENNIMLLAAQKQLYIEAKSVRSVKTYVSTIIAIFLPMLYFIYPEIKLWIVLLSTFWLIISKLILNNLEKKKIKQAATIQEEFDVDLMQLSWNKVMVGNKVTREIIIDASGRFKGDRNKLKNWYPKSASSNHLKDILICQRSNLVWDWRLKEVYAWMIIILMTTFFLSEIIITLVMKKTFSEYLQIFLIPSLSAIITGIESILSLFSIAKEKQNKEVFINTLFEKSDSDQNLSLDVCRQIQDFIYVNRLKETIIPEFWYNLLRKRYETTMHDAAKNMQQ